MKTTSKKILILISLFAILMALSGCGETKSDLEKELEHAQRTADELHKHYEEEKEEYERFSELAGEYQEAYDKLYGN